MTAMTLISPDLYQRQALVAIELMDPVTLTTVSKGMMVKAVGLNGSPIKTWSGRFAWYAEGDAWPTKFLIDPGGQPYELEMVDAPTRPPQPNVPKLGEVRIVRVMLRPTTAYPFGEGVTVVRGKLCETEALDSNPVEGAEIWIRWLNAPPPGVTTEWVDAPIKARTNKVGEFVAILRLPVSASPEKEVGEDRLKTRIAISRNDQVREQFESVANWKIYMLPEGRLFDLTDMLAWNKLIPV